ncbi:hypothetical protein Scep_023138 [Stephania cephalantha]|uniref:Isoamylase n=1 Tax=Stephania cephalantha TaxID=152367 RepID=A0AAP0EZR0_9MAGN
MGASDSFDGTAGPGGVGGLQFECRRLFDPLLRFPSPFALKSEEFQRFLAMELVQSAPSLIRASDCGFRSAKWRNSMFCTDSLQELESCECRSSAIRYVRKTKSFAIKASGGEGGVEATETTVVEKPRLRRFEVLVGSPMPFGATAMDGGVNFAIHSSCAVSATLCLMSVSDLEENRVTEQINLDPLINKTGDIWHAFLKGDFVDMLYGYKFDGKLSPKEGHYYDSSRILLDPYAKVIEFIELYSLLLKLVVANMQVYIMVFLPLYSILRFVSLRFFAVISREQYGALGPDGNCWSQMAGMVPSSDNAFDWEGDLPLNNPQRDLIIYEMHVRGFTKHESSNATYPGTYRGVVEKLDHLKYAILVKITSVAERRELGIGYAIVLVMHSGKKVMELGINCIELMPCQEYNELEYFSYNSVFGDYKMNFWGYSTLNYFSPMLRYSYAGKRNCGHDAINEVKFLVREAHKRGIEVIMDVVFNHTAEGNEKGPIISFRGVDNSVYYMLAPKLIAEAWDAGGLYQVGSFPHWGIWSEWNGKYRDIVRQFIKGTDGFSGAFAECLCGSPNLYQGGRKPWNSINFVCAHDGFTLADLVTYNKKHNLANGENNMDGESHNSSWNCGQEGEFARLPVKRLRKRQMRNFFLCLMVSQIDSAKQEIYIAFNTSHLSVTVALPERPGFRWEPLVDTSKPTPYDFLSDDVPERDIAVKQYSHFLDANLYPMLSYSSIILVLASDYNA